MFIFLHAVCIFIAIIIAEPHFCNNFSVLARFIAYTYRLNLKLRAFSAQFKPLQTDRLIRNLELRDAGKTGYVKTSIAVDRRYNMGETDFFNLIVLFKTVEKRTSVEIIVKQVDFTDGKNKRLIHFKLKIIDKTFADSKPYEHNSRKNDSAVDAVKKINRRRLDRRRN